MDAADLIANRLSQSFDELLQRCERLINAQRTQNSESEALNTNDNSAAIVSSAPPSRAALNVPADLPTTHNPTAQQANGGNNSRTDDEQTTSSDAYDSDETLLIEDLNTIDEIRNSSRNQANRNNSAEPNRDGECLEIHHY